MEMWFSDEHTEDVKLSIRVREQLFSAQSEFQQIDVLDSKEFGKILVVDGDLTLTEKDEFIYHEMITHVPMAVILLEGCSGNRRRRRRRCPGACKV